MFHYEYFASYVLNLVICHAFSSLVSLVDCKYVNVQKYLNLFKKKIIIAVSISALVLQSFDRSDWEVGLHLRRGGSLRAPQGENFKLLFTTQSNLINIKSWILLIYFLLLR